MKIKKVENFTDDRGAIMFASSKLLDFDYKYLTIGTIEHGAVRGGHYHKRIFEKLLCVSGEIIFSLEKDGLSEERYLTPGDIVDIPIGYIHTVRNEGENTATFVEFKSEEFDENDKDTYSKDD